MPSDAEKPPGFEMVHAALERAASLAQDATNKIVVEQTTAAIADYEARTGCHIRIAAIVQISVNHLTRADLAS